MIINDEWIVIWKEISYPISRHHSVIYLDGLRKTTEDLNRHGMNSCLDCNRTHAHIFRATPTCPAVALNGKLNPVNGIGQCGFGERILFPSYNSSNRVYYYCKCKPHILSQQLQIQVNKSVIINYEKRTSALFKELRSTLSGESGAVWVTVAVPKICPKDFAHSAPTSYRRKHVVRVCVS
jgi:hypothetical protein